MMAAILNNMIPSLMLDCILTKVEFSATNQTMNGDYNVQMSDIEGFAGEGVNLQPYAQAFLDRIEREVMPDITRNKQMIVSLRVRADIMGESQFGISINGESEVPYIVPTFSDALTAPVVSDNSSILSQMSGDINQIVGNIDISLVAGGQRQAHAVGNGSI
jgi:hypothetical protein